MFEALFDELTPRALSCVGVAAEPGDKFAGVIGEFAPRASFCAGLVVADGARATVEVLPGAFAIRASFGVGGIAGRVALDGAL